MSHPQAKNEIEGSFSHRHFALWHHLSQYISCKAFREFLAPAAIKSEIKGRIYGRCIFSLCHGNLLSHLAASRSPKSERAHHFYFCLWHSWRGLKKYCAVCLLYIFTTKRCCLPKAQHIIMHLVLLLLSHATHYMCACACGRVKHREYICGAISFFLWRCVAFKNIRGRQSVCPGQPAWQPVALSVGERVLGRIVISLPEQPQNLPYIVKSNTSHSCSPASRTMAHSGAEQPSEVFFLLNRPI